MNAYSFTHFGGPASYPSSNRTPDLDSSFPDFTSSSPWSLDGSFKWTSGIPSLFGVIDGDGFCPDPSASLNQFKFCDQSTAQYSTQDSPPDLSRGTTSLSLRASGDFEKDTPKTLAGNSFHGQIHGISTICCNECGTAFEKKSALALHAKHTKHAAYICKCGEKCSRLDVLKRHIKTFQPTTTHPCPYCNKFRDSKAFTRRDHLLQHWRGYHNIEPISDSDEFQSTMRTRPRMRKELSCPHEDCPYFCSQDPQNQRPFQENDPAFRTRSELTRHLREVHNESPFECTEPYCSRNGGRGFFREGDLLRHQKEHHSMSAGA